MHFPLARPWRRVLVGVSLIVVALPSVAARAQEPARRSPALERLAQETPDPDPSPTTDWDARARPVATTTQPSAAIAPTAPARERFPKPTDWDDLAKPRVDATLIPKPSLLDRPDTTEPAPAPTPTPGAMAAADADDARRQKALDLQAAGDWDGAYRVTNEAIRLAPGRYEAYITRAGLLMTRKLVARRHQPARPGAGADRPGRAAVALIEGGSTCNAGGGPTPRTG